MDLTVLETRWLGVGSTKAKYILIASHPGHLPQTVISEADTDHVAKVPTLWDCPGPLSTCAPERLPMVTVDVCQPGRL